MDPPCAKGEWEYLADLPGAPAYLQNTEYGIYMNKICRACFGERLVIKQKVREKIRLKGGLDRMRPPKQVQEEFRAAHANDVVLNRPAKITGLQSEGGAVLNGQVCKLRHQDPETRRWTVEMLNGELKAMKEECVECSEEIDKEWEKARSEYLAQNPVAAQMVQREVPRPLGSKTAWPKIRGIHPGAMVRLRGLTGATDLEGRLGRCIKFDAETGRWEVDLGDERKAIKIENLVPAPKEKPPTKESAAAEKEEFARRAEQRKRFSEREKHARDYGWTS